MPKFSVLLPTRNRLEYLKYAITSVLKQDYNDWEIIVSDNDSEDDIKGYVDSLKDTRIKYFRTKSFIPVTENWNNAHNHSQGDYVIMLGDDDGLMPGYFSKMLKFLETYNSPDLIYSTAYVYMYPGVDPGFPNGLLNIWGNASFLDEKKEPFFLEKKEINKVVREIMSFHMAFCCNMQFSLISRQLIKKITIDGKFYHSPYPDYYATPSLLLNAEKVLVVPQPLVIVGITPKSFGFFYLNNKESQGNEFLKNIPEDDIAQRIKKHLLPGPNMNSSWLCSMETIKKHFGKKFNLKVKYQNYRLMQLLHFFGNYANYNENVSRKEIKSLIPYLSIKEKIFSYPLLYLAATLIRKIPKKRTRTKRFFTEKMINGFSHPKRSMINIEGKFNTLLDVLEKV